MEQQALAASENLPELFKNNHLSDRAVRSETDCREAAPEGWKRSRHQSNRRSLFLTGCDDFKRCLHQASMKIPREAPEIGIEEGSIRTKARKTADYTNSTGASHPSVSEKFKI